MRRVGCDGQAAKGRRGQADGDEDGQNRPPQGQDGYDEAADQANADLFYNEHLFPVDDDDDRQRTTDDAPPRRERRRWSGIHV